MLLKLNSKNIFFFYVLYNSYFILLKNFYFILYFKKFFFFFKKFIFINNYFCYSFIKNNKIFRFFYLLSEKMFKKILYLYCGFSYFRIFFKIGLGFRKKVSHSRELFIMYTGLRHWVCFNSFPSDFFFNVRRRSIYIFSENKSKLHFYLVHLKYLKKETIFKVKGIMIYNRFKIKKKASRAIIFARRVKFRKIKLKLTKKQKQRR